VSINVVYGYFADVYFDIFELVALLKAWLVWA